VRDLQAQSPSESDAEDDEVEGEAGAGKPPDVFANSGLSESSSGMT